MKEHAKSEKATKVGPTTQNLMGAFARRVYLTVFAFVLLVQSVIFADLPGFRAPLLTTPATPSDFRSGASSTPSGEGWDSNNVDAEIKELARGLQYSPGLMYKFVHDYIKFDPIWGDLKGPYMTWMDRSGGAYDQASLMITLLEEAEQQDPNIADPNYVVGEIQLTAAQFMNWFNVIDDPDEAKAVLARAGLYGTVTETGGGDISNVKIEHVWVKVKIGGETYEFDPSFKSYTNNYGLNSWQLKSAMGYTRSTFLSNANHSENYISVDNIDEAAIRDDLSTYSANLIEYIRDNLSDGGLADVVGGRRITPVDVNELPPDSLPYTVVSQGGYDYEFDMANTPDMYRTSLRIQHAGIDETFWSSEIYGRRLSLRYNGSDQPELVLDGTTIDTGNATTEGNQYDLTLTVTHPYDSTDFDGTVTVKVTSGGFYNIVNGWGDTNIQIIEKHRADLEQYRYDEELDSSEKVLGESYAIVGLTWLAQTSKMRSLAATKACYRSMLINHHMVGVAGQYGTPYIDMPLGHLGVYGEQDPNGVFLTVAGHASAYEHEVIRQLQDCNSVSTVALLQQANDRSENGKIYSADSSNWTTVQSNLQSYSQAEKDLVSSYINDGFTVRLPEYGDLGQDDWTGIGFQAVDADSSEMAAGYIISGGYSGGAATGNNEALSPADLLDRGDIFAGEREGTYHHGATDMTIGTGGMPFGLSLSRSYSSERRLQDGPLGLGWTHNFDISANVKSDSFRALGGVSPIDAAAHIVALCVSHDILTYDSDGLADNVIATLIETWLMDQMMDNIVTIEQGGEKMQFVKVPDANDPNGSYSRTDLKLVLNEGNFRLKTPNGIFNDFDSSGRMSEWSNAFGSKVAFTYSSGKLQTVACKIDCDTPSWSLTFHYDANDRIDYVIDSASPSRTIYYHIDVDGNLTEYTNPDGNDITYGYDDTNDGQLTELFSPLDAVNPVLTNVYDSIGRLKQQIDVNDYAVDYYLAGYRAETLEPNQTDPNGITKRFSTVVWADEFGRPISATDQLGRESTHEYDGKLRLIKSTSAYGTSSEYQYDQYDRVKQRDSKVKLGSSDPNISVTFDHDSNENEDGRWFINQTEATDPNGYTVYQYYDYNDVPTYKTSLGLLMKTVYPEVEAGTATVEFEYNDYGQITKKIDPCDVNTVYEYYPVANGSTLKKVIIDANGTSPLAITTEFTYDSVGNVISVKDPRGNITTSEYYDSRLLKKVTYPDSNEVNYEYYDDGKLQHVKQNTSEDGWIYHQSITYNARGQKQTVKGPYKSGQDLGINLTTFDYDALGRPWKVTDAEGNTTETRYYPDGKVWRVIDAEDHNNVTNTYDVSGKLIKVEDAAGNATQYEYNGFGGLSKTIYPDGTWAGPITLSSIREVREARTRAGDVFEMWYDDMNRIKKRITPEGQIIKYKYDLRGRLIETYEQYALSPKSKLIKNTYDDVGRITKVEYDGDREVSYEYDDCSNRTKLTYPDGSYITYEYDVLNRLTKIKDDTSPKPVELATYTYDSLSRRTDLNYANGTTIDYTYDAASRLTTIDSTTDNESHEYDYTYDKVGNRLTMLVGDTDTHTYTYDDIYQLTNVDYPNGYAFEYDTEFIYDDVGNRISDSNGTGTTVYQTNNLNQYNFVDGVSNDDSYDYDLNGNTTFDDVACYTYDSENRLTSATNASGSTGGMFNAALDNMVLTFTTGGDANWVPVNPDTNDPNFGGPDSAKSGTISASQESWLQTTVTGAGTFKFYYKKAAGTNDYFRLKVDGDTCWGIYNNSNSIPWSQKSYTIGFGTHTLQWHYSKGGSGIDSDGGLWIDRVEWIPNENSTSLQQALDTGWAVVTGGDEDWFKESWPAYNGYDSAESGDIQDDQSSQMEATVEGEGTVSFYWKVSSEEGYDYLKFYIDGVLQEDPISGEVDWQQKSYNLVGSGSHSLLWEYVKDGSGSDPNYDCGWVDYIQGPGSAPPEPDSMTRLADSLDCDLTITIGGDADWYSDIGASSTSYYDNDATYINSVYDDEEAWMQTTVTAVAGDKVSFYWKVSSESGSDYLKFYIDNQYQDGISGEVDWQKKSYSLSAGSRTLKWVYSKNSSDTSGDDQGWVDGLYVGSGSLVIPPDDYYSEAVDSHLKFTQSGDGIWYVASGTDDEYYYDGDAVHSTDTLDNDEETCLQTIVESDSSETIKFHWKVSSESGSDYLKFYIDDSLQDSISGEVDWQQKSYNVSSGIHTLKWVYIKDSSGDDGDDCGWVDFVQWTGPSPAQDPSNWQTINYKHDVYGRRSEKKVDGFSTRYVYDGDHVIAEYDGNNNLLRKYIYGPGIDQPVCMIEVADSNAVYYYHFDALGSVVALSDSSGDTVQTYEYSVYGQVAVEDINHPNPYMFAGRRFDIEIGLYYNRARYYNPYTGRFLQADPIGYGDGMNMYAYCGNSPIGRVDPSGLDWIAEEGGLWGQDYAMSCTAASLVNMVWELFYTYGEAIKAKYGHTWEPWGEEDFREALDGRHGSDEEWNSRGLDKMETLRKVLNEYLDSEHVDPGRKVLPRYIVKYDWEESVNDILGRVKDKGPIMFIENLGGETLWESSHFVDKNGNPITVTASNSTLHAVTLLGTYSEDTSKYRYWDPMWDYNAVATYPEDSLTNSWTAKKSYNYGVLVPIVSGEAEYMTIDIVDE